MKTRMAIGEGSILKLTDSQSGMRARLAATRTVCRNGPSHVQVRHGMDGRGARVAFWSHVVS
jgi:hypothetical protein